MTRVSDTRLDATFRQLVHAFLLLTCVFVRLFVTQKAKVGMTERVGVLSLQDMKGYKAVNRKHVNTTYRGNTIIGMGSPSSGGIAIAQVRTEFVLI
jgi:hypothetical protein